MLGRFMAREGIEFNINTGIKSEPHNLAVVLDAFFLSVDPADESVAQNIIRDGFWEGWVTSWMTKVIDPGWVCLDIGANFGYYTGVMQYLGKRVIAFEPNPDIAGMLQVSCIANDWKNVAIAEVALGSVEGRGILTLNPHLMGSGSMLEDEHYFQQYGNTIQYEVDVIPLDSYSIYDADFVKIDAEGFEPAIFEGGSKTLDNAQIIAVELTKDHPKEFLDMLFEKYEVTNINYDGFEEPICRVDIDTLDWAMVALRRK